MKTNLSLPPSLLQFGHFRVARHQERVLHPPRGRAPKHVFRALLEIAFC
jgi:hypothetical protein